MRVGKLDAGTYDSLLDFSSSGGLSTSGSSSSPAMVTDIPTVTQVTVQPGTIPDSGTMDYGPTGINDAGLATDIPADTTVPTPMPAKTDYSTWLIVAALIGGYALTQKKSVGAVSKKKKKYLLPLLLVGGAAAVWYFTRDKTPATTTVTPSGGPADSGGGTIPPDTGGGGPAPVPLVIDPAVLDLWNRKGISSSVFQQMTQSEINDIEQYTGEAVAQNKVLSKVMNNYLNDLHLLDYNPDLWYRIDAINKKYGLSFPLYNP